MTTENWVTVKPYRSFQTTDPKILKQQIIQSFNNSFQNSTFNNDFDFSFIDDVIEEEQIIDLISKIDCKRFQGFIRLGLFKGTWLLNYGFGCKYRLNRASIIDVLSKDKIFDQTLWLCTILCCSLSLFAILLSAIFSLLNAFLSPSNPIHGPLSMYLWNSLSAVFHALAILIFTAEFYFYINKNVLNQEQMHSGWISTDCGKLGWSFFILFISFFLIITNIIIIYAHSKVNQSFLNFRNIKNFYEKNETLIDDVTEAKNHNLSIDEPIRPENESSSDLNVTSRRLKRIIDFIY
ncbi:Clarin [Brachionus plicatilis]|uniref:Clarin n=1 Tax=Brachionus plicatilis TaxID=10195 RepID=A0A3M7SN50_BRAPC|nr:Clarin [Brachionus plicatilis]